MHKRTLPILAALLVLGACDFLGPGTDGQRLELEQQREAWAALDIRDYDFTLQLSCFCPPDYLEPVVLSVRDGRIVTATHAATGAPLPPAPAGGYEHYYTVEQLFDLVERGVSGPWVLDSLHFDAGLHYPRGFSTHLPNALDSGITVLASGLVVVQ